MKLSSIDLRGDGPKEKTEFDAVLTKPIRRSSLFDRINALLYGADDGTMISKSDRSYPQITDTASGHQIRVLVVEDNTTNQKVARHILTKFGCHADVVGNGLEAVDAFQNITYDLIIMDVQMPVMDGLAATRKIRELEARGYDGAAAHSAHIPIVALTANVMKGDRENCLAAGMDDFLAKPINPQEVRHMIDQWVR